MNYCFTKPLKLPFGDAVEKVIEQLKQHGFGVLSDIDVKATLKKTIEEFKVKFLNDEFKD